MPNSSKSTQEPREGASGQDLLNSSPLPSTSDRRAFLQWAAATATAGAATLAWPALAHSAIAAENRGMNEGCDLTMRMLRDAGFQQATRIPTDGQPGIFATLDAGASHTLGLYYMYDVKQAEIGRAH